MTAKVWFLNHSTRPLWAGSLFEGEQMGSIVTCYPEFWVKESMTAIIRTLTLEGTVLAADGRNTGAVDGTVISDSVQKIFPVATANGTAAYCLCGTVNVISDDRLRVVVDIADEIRKSAESLTNRRTGSLVGYATRLFRPVCTALRDAYEGGEFSQFASQPTSPFERGDTILRVYFHEYRDGLPSSVAVRLYQENGKLAEPEIVTEPLLPIHRTDLPVPRIGGIVLGGREEPTLAAYRQPNIEMTTCTLNLAIERSRALIDAHTDPEAIAIDPLCRTVGGHIHIATITPSEGFKWVVSPLQYTEKV